MSIGLEKILQIKSKMKLEQLYNIFISLIVVLILILAFLALKRPISVQQFNNVVIHQLKCLCDKPFKMSCF